MELSINVNIPALDRLCDWLEKGATVNVNSAPTLVDVPETPAPKARKAAKAETASEAPEGPKQPPKAEPVQVPTQEPAPAQPEPVASPAPALTVNDIMRAAAALRDQGKLAAVTGLFPQFGVKKLSDLQEDQLGEFADHLRKLGATI